ncbi:GntR family transcriptional regulator [Kribbella turkmenica]|uniref:GntR family transcriptional regulator n=1 Tax=Kribbella turkmenica TaxID=2530375 RepID=A0A4R4XGN0_9ACTN|nr:tyrosine-type recombinase/integrase [Kribbella turkmenica]TDD29993.1 GntR family transcriptional regulator [Kribbella turkmenica]
MAKAPKRRQRARGSVEELPSGALRVVVYAGIDPVTKRRHYLRETIPANTPKAAEEAERAIRRLQSQVDERRQPRTNASLSQLIERHLELAELDETTRRTYRGYVRNHIEPLIGHVKVGAVDADVLDSYYAELRRCRHHCDRRPFTEHRTKTQHECDQRCRSHECRPLGASTVRQIHFILSGAFRQAVRWKWVSVNPMPTGKPPSAPKPNPRPPTADEAARILGEAFTDPAWGTFVWLAMVTGARRGELCALRWSKFDLDQGTIVIDTSVAQNSSKKWLKDTKTHQQRRLTLDTETVVLLRQHRRSCDETAAKLETKLCPDAFVFSLSPDNSEHLVPDSVSQRYSKLAARLGIDTHLHNLRHYSATELIAAGVDIRTVAGRLGHGGGGTTTLRVYTAFVSEADQRAARALFDRLPNRPEQPTERERILRNPRAPYEAIAGKLSAAIESGLLPPGTSLPPTKQMAEQHGVSQGTIRRALDLLRTWDLLDEFRRINTAR